MSLGMGVSSLVIISVLSQFGGTAGVLAGLEGLRAFLDATLVHVGLGKAGGGGALAGRPGGADWGRWRWWGLVD